MQSPTVEPKMKSKILLGLCVPIMFTLMSTAQPSQSPGVAAVVATVEVATEMEAAPTDCGPSPEAIEINKKYYGPVLGTWPIWGTIYAGQNHIGVLAMPHEHPTSSWLRDWWGQKVLWLVSTSYKAKSN